MGRIRVLVGTRKGGFICQSDANRRDWQIVAAGLAPFMVVGAIAGG